jgi:hypothetical protein
LKWSAVREIDIVAGVAVAICAVLGYLSRNVLNPDGVAYLDLASALRAGDWTHFVQGYWSPIYPALVMVAAVVTGRQGPDLVGVAHVVNTAIAAAAVVLLWREARRKKSAIYGRAVIAALLVCSARPPRVDAVTPDLLLLVTLLVVTQELVFHAGERWVRTGFWLGISFLVKTSIWPWLLLVLVVRLWDAGARHAYRPVLLSTLVCLGMALLWIVPMSVQEHRITPGSAGRLNACWYLRSCDSRTPDTHSGGHMRYRDVRLDDGPITIASFDGATWTYEPWSDPTAWEKGVLSRAAHLPAIGAAIAYWATLFRLVFGLWLLQLLLAVMIPVFWISRRRNMWPELVGRHRGSLVAMTLGLLGAGQFIVIHAEPRLIAPFALTFAVGALAWLCATRDSPASGSGPRHATDDARRAPRRAVIQVASWIGLASAAPLAIARMNEEASLHDAVEQRTSSILRATDALVPGGPLPRRVVIIGPALPFVADIYRTGGRIVAQVLPRSSELVAHLPSTTQRELVDRLFAGQADLAWFTKPDEIVRMAVVAKK